MTLNEAGGVRELDHDALVRKTHHRSGRYSCQTSRTFSAAVVLNNVERSYVATLFDGLFEGLREDLQVGGSLLLGLSMSGDVETHLHRSNRSKLTSTEGARYTAS